MRLFVCIAVFIIATASLTINNIYKNISFRSLFSLDRGIYWFTQVQFLYLSPMDDTCMFPFFELYISIYDGRRSHQQNRKKRERAYGHHHYDMTYGNDSYSPFFSLLDAPSFPSYVFRYIYIRSSRRTKGAAGSGEGSARDRHLCRWMYIERCISTAANELDVLLKLVLPVIVMTKIEHVIVILRSTIRKETIVTNNVHLIQIIQKVFCFYFYGARV